MKKKTKKIIFLSSITFVVVSLVSTLWTLQELVFARNSKGIKPTDEDIKYLYEHGLVYDHVIIFGVDGAGGYFPNVDTPHFDRIFDGGSVTYTGMSQWHTESAQNWTSMIHGVKCQTHGVENSNVDDQPYTDSRYPSFFKEYAYSHEGAKMAAINDWESINKGIIENDIPGLTKIDAGRYCEEECEGLDWVESEKVIDRVVSELVINEIQTNHPSIIFMHFDTVDSSGHTYGSSSQQYRDGIQYVDQLMGNIYDAAINQGWHDNTLFIAVTDHGHKPNGGHGWNQPIVCHTTLAVNGHKGNIIAGEAGYYVTHDLASVVMYALGEKQPSSWEGGVPENIFKNLTK